MHIHFIFFLVGLVRCDKKVFIFIILFSLEILDSLFIFISINISSSFVLCCSLHYIFSQSTYFLKKCKIYLNNFQIVLYSFSLYFTTRFTELKKKNNQNHKTPTTKIKINCPRQSKYTYCITAYKHNGIAKSINHVLTVLFYVDAYFFPLFNYFQRIFPC